jgi:hypothetical protein
VSRIGQQRTDGLNGEWFHAGAILRSARNLICIIPLIATEPETKMERDLLKKIATYFAKESR